MFCFQCEQAAKGTGCDTMGVCGKKPGVSNLQDVIVHQLKGIGHLGHQARKLGIVDSDIDRHVVEALFSTVTNVDFDFERLEGQVRKGHELKMRLRDTYLAAARDAGEAVDETRLPASVSFVPADTDDELVEQGNRIGILAGPANQDLRSLQQLLTYGLKGMAAYADHALLLGKTDETVMAFFYEALAALNRVDPSIDELVELNMRCGKVNIRTMEILDAAHTERFSHPEPATVPTGLQEGPALVVSGHDLLDLEALLRQTEGTGVKVYTHGEMLPAHGYPGLKKYEHLAGHFGTAWQNQQKEFDSVPAAFLFTTNCIQRPRSSYIENVYTCGLVAWPGVKHIANRDFAPVIQKARELGGYEQDNRKGSLTTGFGRNAVLGVADKVVEAVKSGAIKHFLLVGGCDGAKPGRNYYTELVEKTPADTVILTLACGKFRFNHMDLGTIGGIPRLLDIGQCNDAYSAIKIASALAEAFDTDVNGLPLSLVLSWYEQKAVVILLSLLSLGIRDIRVGPTLPAFLSPNVLALLSEKFNLQPIGTPETDLQAILAA